MTDTVPPPPPSAHAMPVVALLRRSARRWRLLAFLALAIAVLALGARFAGERGGVGPYIAKVDISGTIATDPERLDLLAELADDPMVAAVIVRINSPGGTTAGGEELFEALGRLRDSKPVAAVIDELGASAAYMTAIGADRIFARRLSIVGSIGVLYQHINAGGLLQRIGIDLDKVASGPLKAEPDFDEPIAPHVRESLEALIGDSYSYFVDIVAERRGLTREATLALADGRIVTGSMAIEAGLIDAIGGEREAIGWLEADKGVAAGLVVLDRFPEPEQGLAWLWGEARGEARAMLGLPSHGPIVLDGLVSLWQVTGGI